MIATPTDTNWPGGTLRACESVESIIAKLAIYNHVEAFHYQRQVESRSLTALARLLREPLHRVRGALERPAWVDGMDTLLERSVVFLEARAKLDAESAIMPATTAHRYCNHCMRSFYHSWMHDLSWLDHCFVHRRVKLTKVPYVNLMPSKSMLVKHLHERWQPVLASYIRTPQDFSDALATLSNRRLIYAVKALGTMFVPETSDKDDMRSFECHPVALGSWLDAYQHHEASHGEPSGNVDGDVSSDPPDLSDPKDALGGMDVDTAPQRGAGVGTAPLDGAGADVAPLGGVGVSAAPPDGADPETVRNARVEREDANTAPASFEVAPWEFSSADVGTITRSRGHTRCAIACAVASATRQTTDNLLTRHHPEHREMRFLGEARFACYSRRPHFWGHLAHVLSTGVKGPERSLIEGFISRLSHGHEDCLGSLRKCYGRQDHLSFAPETFHEDDYIAYHLRDHGICPRLLTLDLVTRMLRPQFLCQMQRRKGAEDRAGKGRDNWLHAGLRPRGLFESHEWLPYERKYEATLVYPHSSELEHFTHHLNELECAFLRRERQGHGSKRIDHAMHDVLFDQRLVSVAATQPDRDGHAGQLLYTYFSAKGGQSPDWGELAQRDAGHAQRTANLLEEIRVSDLKPTWTDTLLE